MSVWHLEECRHTQVRCTPSPLNIPSTTELYYTISVWHVGECRHTKSDLHSLLIHPSATQPYYTMSVLHVGECRYTHVRCITPQFTLVVQSPTTPCQFDIWKNAGIPRSDLHPPLIEPSATELYYTMSVWYVEECRCTQVRTFCHNTYVNWLKCFHVTILNNWWSHVEWYVEDSSEIIWWIIFFSMNREDKYPSFALNTWCRWWTVV